MKIPIEPAPSTTIQMQAAKQDAPLFSKMAGGGNDFVILDNRAGRFGDVAELTRRVCTAHLSVGADGLILIEPSQQATFRMRYLNADGSEADFCANGTRCAARFAFTNGIASRTMTIETGGGITGAEIGEGTLVTLTLQPPHSFRREHPLRVGETLIHGSSLMVGVPHYVVFLQSDLWGQDIVPLGRAIRNHPDLPQGANVNFVVIRDSRSIEVRTYERGVEAETLSCGSGVVASSVMSGLVGSVRSPVSILTRSGITLQVSYSMSGEDVRDVQLRGDARLIFQATLTDEALQGFDPEFVRRPASSLTGSRS